jgi:hypothetical protein
MRHCRRYASGDPVAVSHHPGDCLDWLASNAVREREDQRMNFGAIALLVDGLMTAAVGFMLLHKLHDTGDVVNEQIAQGVQQLIENAPEILQQAMIGGQKSGENEA